MKYVFHGDRWTFHEFACKRSLPTATTSFCVTYLWVGNVISCLAKLSATGKVLPGGLSPGRRLMESGYTAMIPSPLSALSFSKNRRFSLLGTLMGNRRSPIDGRIRNNDSRFPFACSTAIHRFTLPRLDFCISPSLSCQLTINPA